MYYRNCFVIGVSVMPRRGDHAHAGQSPGSYWLKWHVSDAQKRDCVRRRQPREIRYVEMVKLEYFREQYALAEISLKRSRILDVGKFYSDTFIMMSYNDAA